MEGGSASRQWECKICTFRFNPNSATECEACLSPKPKNQGTSTVSTAPPAITVDLTDWDCPICTLVNIGVNTCSACGFEKTEKNDRPSSFKKVKRDDFKVCPFPSCGASLSPDAYDEHLSLHQFEINSQADEEFTRLRRRYGFESVPEKGTNYLEQYEKSLEADWANAKISAEEVAEKKEKLHKNIRGAEMYKTWGIIGMIKTCYQSAKGVQHLLLSDPVDHYSSDRGDSGWGCGYRNIQMLSSHLLTLETYKSVLFGGCGYVPTIPSLQEWIETAWSKGFDVQGCKQLGGTIFNTKRMIGATECAALLRSFGIRAKVVDFISAKNPKYVPPRDEEEAKMKGKKDSPYKSNKELLDWVWKYYQSRAKTPFSQKSFAPPLYLQHDGHSRTIVGVERRGNQTNLLIFDPSHWGSVLRSDLTDHKLRKLKKGLDTFTRGKYQIVYVEEGLMTSSEVEDAKDMDSEQFVCKG